MSEHKRFIDLLKEEPPVVLKSSTALDLQEMQDRIVGDMDQFSLENPGIAEALTVMNIELPDYVIAISALQGGNIVSASIHTLMRAEEQKNG